VRDFADTADRAESAFRPGFGTASGIKGTATAEGNVAPRGRVVKAAISTRRNCLALAWSFFVDLAAAAANMLALILHLI
jgi:hypothetical protein